MNVAQQQPQSIEPVKNDSPDYEKMTMAVLRALCVERKIVLEPRARKNAIIEALTAADAAKE